MVTGGSGFLGKNVVCKLNERSAAPFVVDTGGYDLRKLEDIRRALNDGKPQMVIHLAARVGGIGANSEYPAEFFYDNVMMSIPLLHESWLAGVDKFVALGTITKANMTAIEQIHSNAGRLVTGLPTGYDRFNEMTSGFQPQDLIILAARPSMGKTSFMMNIAESIALPGKDGLPRNGGDRDVFVRSA